MKPILTSLLIFCSFAVFSQTKTIDSLKNVYYSKMDSSSAKIEIDKIISNINKVTDDFTDKVTYYSTILKPVTLTKAINNGTTSYYISFRTMGSTLNVDGVGVYVLFSDGSKWTKLSEKIKAGYEDGWEYTTFTSINLTELRMFQRKKVAKFRLYIYDQEVNSDFAQEFQLQTAIMETFK